MAEQTIGEAILEAQATIRAATERRNALLLAARQNGVSLRVLGKLVGATASTVMRWAPLEDDSDVDAASFLDLPATRADA